MDQTAVNILHLPREIVLQIMGYVKLCSKYNLTRTCRQLYVLWDGTLLTAHDKQKLRRQQRKFAMTRSIKNADSWYCMTCNTDHPISERDTPAAPLSTCSARLTYREVQNTHGWEGYCLRHRHLQMILNYFQKETLTARQETHLNTLMLPFHSSRSYWSLPFSGSRSVPVTEEFAIRPRVCDGRLIIYYGFTYYCPDGSMLSAASMPAAHICRHITMRQLLFDRHGRLEIPRDAGPPYHNNDYNFSFGRLFREMILGKSRYTYAYNDSQPGMKTCRYCRTDYLFLTGISRVQLLVFKDYGENKSPFDLSWRVQSRKAGRDIVDMRPISTAALPMEG